MANNDPKLNCADCINHNCTCKCTKGGCDGLCKLTEEKASCTKKRCDNYKLDPFFLRRENMLKED